MLTLLSDLFNNLLLRNWTQKNYTKFSERSLVIVLSILLNVHYGCWDLDHAALIVAPPPPPGTWEPGVLVVFGEQALNVCEHVVILMTLWMWWPFLCECDESVDLFPPLFFLLLFFPLFFFFFFFFFGGGGGGGGLSAPPAKQSFPGAPPPPLQQIVRTWMCTIGTS